MTAMTSLQRVLTTLGHQEPDRVPFFLLVTMHGARELGLSMSEYFSRGDHVAEGQLRMRARYGHDCLYTFFYASLETEAWGMKTLFRDDGPANAGAPLVQRRGDIMRLTPPDVSRAPALKKVLDATSIMKQKVGDEAPIIGVVMSPFSLPVMQLGFENYLNLLLEGDPAELDHLLRINEEFCVAWANAQVQAGATAICYFDPISSTSMVSADLYKRHGLVVARRTLARIQAPAAVHLASGRCIERLDDLALSGAAVVGVSTDEDLAELKRKAAGKLTILGNLNGIEMCRWTPAEAEAAVKQAIQHAGPGGGFILSDNHGEIPFQVSEDTLQAVADAVRRWGRYPLDWTCHAP